jgi:hypothetical protein
MVFSIGFYNPVNGMKKARILSHLKDKQSSPATDNSEPLRKFKVATNE